MNHPRNEQWVSYCYGEVNAEQRAELMAHLEACPDCTRNLEAWQRTQADLNEWRVRGKRRRTVMPTALKWAAVGVVICLSFVVGRIASSTQNIRGLQATLESELKSQLRAELSRIWQEEKTATRNSLIAASEERTKALLKVFASEISASQKQQMQALYAALDKIDSQRASDYTAVKKELDTLAVNADAELRATQRHLLDLVTYAQPSTFSPQE
jgi:anti-sigma factor RsiW